MFAITPMARRPEWPRRDGAQVSRHLLEQGRGMKRIAVVSGLATLDYVLTTNHPLAGTGTVKADLLTNGSWPRAGGAPLYTSSRLVAHGHDASPLVSVGSDANGRAYRDACIRLGLDAGGIVETFDGKTPSCVLIYHEIGGYSCLLDTGTCHESEPSAAQRSLTARANLIALAAANPEMTGHILCSVTNEQRVAWLVKDDPQCFPQDLCRKLAERANFIFFNAGERHLVLPYQDEMPSNAVLFETLGSEGVRVFSTNVDHHITVTAVHARDSTGAGDTFAGEALALILDGQENMSTIADLAGRVVGNFLLQKNLVD